MTYMLSGTCSRYVPTYYHTADHAYAHALPASSIICLWTITIVFIPLCYSSVEVLFLSEQASLIGVPYGFTLR